MTGPEEDRPVCAIADVHGRADLLAPLLDAIERELPDARVVMLGDLIDRGPDVTGALEIAMQVEERFPGSTVLLGNHENWLLAAIEGDLDAWENWRMWGGRATLGAFGIDPELDPVPMREAFEARAPEMLAFLRARPLLWDGNGVADGYVFVHAGIDPVVPLDRQDDHDLIWIREPFLSWNRPVGPLIVHGHTIEDGPVVRPHRIGLDNGAYRTGILSCMILEPDGLRRFIAMREGEGVSDIWPRR